MKKVFLLFGILFFGISVKAQSSLPKNVSDSLWGIWVDATRPDTIRLDAMHKYIWKGYMYSQADSAFYFSNLYYTFAHDRGLKVYEKYAINALGAVCNQKGDYSNALIYFNNTLTLSKEIGDKKGMSVALNNLAIIYLNLGDYDKALTSITESLILKEELGNKDGLADAYHNTAAIYSNLGEHVNAVLFYMKALKLREEVGDKDRTGSTFMSMGFDYFRQGDNPGALELYARAIELFEETGNKTGLSGVLTSLGNLYVRESNYALALQYFMQSLSLKEEIGEKRGIAAAMNGIGKCHFQAGDYNNSMDYYLRSLALSSEIGTKEGIAVTLQLLAELALKKKEPLAAIGYALKSNTISVEMRSTELIRSTASLLVSSYLCISKTDSALFYLTMLKNTVTHQLEMNYFNMAELEKELYFATLEKDFGLYYDLTLFYHNQFPTLPDTAYNIALQNKGLTLKSSTAMRNAVLNSGDSLLIADYENWILLKQSIASLYAKGKETKELESKARELEKTLIKKSNAFSDFDKIKNLDWRQVRDNLKTDECAIEFINFKSEIDTANPIIYAALLITPESEHPEIIRLCNESDLVEILGTFQGNNLGFVNSVYGTREEAQTALYQKIWQPLEKYLDGVKTIYYSPSGLLHKISFASISKTQNIFLSDVYNFRQMGSTGKVALPEDIAFGELENFLLMGGVNYNSQNSSKEVWSYLPGSLQETESINAFLQKKKFGVNYFHSNNASEEIFKEKIVSSSIVHIATHGFFFPDPEKVREEMKADSESNQDLKFRGTTNYANWSFVNNKNPLMRSGIVLANANNVWERDALAEGEDGILTAQEVSNLDLRNTKLVVLSACETGLGDIHGSEGVFGLQRAFKMAGVKYLIMSLWQVPDKETSEFMQLFYKNLIRFKNIPAAFQTTQKIMRKKYDPYYWGAFVLIE